MADPKEIYLSPPCCSDMVGEGRLWCENDEWPEGDCGTPEEHRPATRYVRADIHDEALKRQAAVARAMLEALKTVMQHGRIDNSEARMNLVASAITKAEGAYDG